MNSLTKDIIRFYKEWLTNKRAYQDNLGVSFCFFNKNETIYEDAVGFADIKQKINATPQTIYRCASISKLFTATAIMQLVEKGKINLHDKVLALLPEIQLAEYTDFKNATLFHLLTHSSGLPRESNHPYWSTLQFPDAEAVYEGLKTQKQAIPINTIWKYSNLAFGMLGEIISKYSGEVFEEYIENHIFAPLQLKSSFFRNMDPQHKHLAKGYSRKLPNREREEIDFVDCEYINAAANLCSTVQDLACFYKSFFDGKNVLLQQETINNMLRCQVLSLDWQDGFGLGFKLSRYRQLTFIGHGGAFQGFILNSSFVKEKDFGVIVLSNSTDSDSLAFLRYAYDLILPTMEAKEEKAGDNGVIEKYAGRFRNAWYDILVMPIQGELYYFNLSEAQPFDTKARLKQVSEGQFIFDSQIGGHSIGEPVRFDFDANGEVSKIRIGAGVTSRIKDWVN